MHHAPNKTKCICCRTELARSSCAARSCGIASLSEGAFCAQKVGPPISSTFLTCSCRTTCVERARLEKNKTHFPAEKNTFCARLPGRSETNGLARRCSDSTPRKVHFPVPTGNVEQLHRPPAAPAPIASSVQASTPQFAGFLLYSIAAFYEHRYSTHAYSMCHSATPACRPSRGGHSRSIGGLGSFLSPCFWLPAGCCPCRLVLGTILVDKGSFHGHRRSHSPSSHSPSRRSPNRQQTRREQHRC
jgi:hypothetical protein